jgi:6-pyruvoyltetrahydropterin/6-carboxytetrahydropterin synthase
MMIVELVKDFTLEAAHRLPGLPSGHKCSRLHGHSFKIEVRVRGPLAPGTGWVMDYADIKAAFQPIHDMLDHNYLNDVPGLECPTSEILAGWIWNRLDGTLPGLAEVVVHETCTARAVYRGEVKL